MNRRISVGLLAAFLILAGCKKDNELTETLPGYAPKSSSTPADDALIELGQQEPSPYVLQNINTACALLGMPQKQATYKYIRLNPADAAEYAAYNEREDWELWEFPMDYEIVQDGYMYLANPSQPDAIQPLYTVVPTGFNLSNVNYTVLEELYFPADNEEALENKAYALRGKDPETWENPGMVPKAGNAIKPKGYLRVQDQYLGSLPVVNIKVRAKKGLKVNTVETNVNGFFQMTKKYKGNVKFFTFCDNSRGNIRYLIGNNFLSLLQTYRGTLGTFGQTFYTNFDYTLDPQHTNGTTATMVNNMYRTKLYCDALSVGHHNMKLRYWAHNGSFLGTASGSTPMLKHMNTMPISFLAAGFASFAMSSLLGMPGMPGVGFGGAAAMSAIPLLTIYLELVKPDMYIPFESGNIEISDFNKTMFHEHGHAIHFNKAGGQLYWYPFVLAIVNNGINDPADFYGDYGGTEFGRIGLAESWGHFIGNRFALEMYGMSRPQTYGWAPGTIDVPYFQHMNENRTPDINVNDPDRWIPYGIFHDLIDLKNSGDWTQIPAGTGPIIFDEDVAGVDKTGGYGGTINPNGNDLSKFYQTLSPYITHPTQYKDKFYQLYVNPSNGTEYNALWNWYGY